MRAKSSVQLKGTMISTNPRDCEWIVEVAGKAMAGEGTDSGSIQDLRLSRAWSISLTDTSISNKRVSLRLLFKSLLRARMRSSCQLTRKTTMRTSSKRIHNGMSWLYPTRRSLRNRFKARNCSRRDSQLRSFPARWNERSRSMALAAFSSENTDFISVIFTVVSNLSNTQQLQADGRMSTG